MELTNFLVFYNLLNNQNQRRKRKRKSEVMILEFTKPSNENGNYQNPENKGEIMDEEDTDTFNPIFKDILSQN